MKQWKIIPGHEEYSVSDAGEIMRNETGLIRKGHISKAGYLVVDLWRDNKRKDVVVHRIVASAFLDNPLNLPMVNHKDGNKLNNRSNNLEWCIALHNNRHAILLGLRKKRSILNTEDVLNILNESSNVKPRFIAAKYGITAAYACKIRKGRKWSGTIGHLKHIEGYASPVTLGSFFCSVPAATISPKKALVTEFILVDNNDE